jgi:protein TonB
MGDLKPPPNAAARSRSFLLWAFGISIVVHFVVGNVMPHLRDDPSPDATPLVVKFDPRAPTPPPPTPPPPTPKPVKPRPATSASVAHRPRAHVAPPRTSTHGGGPVEGPAHIAQTGPSQNSDDPNVGPSPIAGVSSTAPPTPQPTPTPRVCGRPNSEARTVRAVEPDYPEIARERGAVGVAQVRVTLSATGAVRDAAIYRSSGDNSLDLEAVKAARASTYTPAFEDCAAVGGQYIFRAEFTMGQ